MPIAMVTADGGPARREQILAAAARLFRAQGYHGTSIDELGTAVGISGPALYRHFSSKQAVLAVLAERAITDLADVVDAPAAANGPAGPAQALATVLRTLVRRVRADRDLAAVVLREARHLRPDLAGPARDARRRLDRGLVDLVLAARPGLDVEEARLLVGALYGLIGLPVFHRSRLGERQIEDLLVEAGLAGLGLGIDGQASDMSRREEILAATVKLVRAEGIDGVGIDAIGAAVGMSGPALYRHFPGGKPELLVAAFESAGSRLARALEEATSVGADTGDRAEGRPAADGKAADGRTAAEAQLRLIVAGYVDVALDASDLIGLYLDEAHALPRAARDRLARAQRAYLARWAEVLCRARPALGAATAGALAHCAVAMVNTAVQRPGFLGPERRREVLVTMALDVLRRPGAAIDDLPIRTVVNP